MIPSCRHRTKRVAALNITERRSMVEKPGQQSSRVVGAQCRFYIQMEEAEKLAGRPMR